MIYCSDEPISIKHSDFVKSFENGLKIIASYDQDNCFMTLGQLSKKTSLARGAVRRSILTLISLGYVAHVDRLYTLTPKVLDLGFSYFMKNNCLPIIRFHLDEVYMATSEQSFFCHLIGLDVVFSACVGSSSRFLKINIAEGKALPAAGTSAGQAILSQLENEEFHSFIAMLKDKGSPEGEELENMKNMVFKARRQGYAIVENDFEPGVTSVAVPVFNREKRVVGAFSIFMHGHAEREGFIYKKILPSLFVQADLIGKDLLFR